MRLFLLVFVLGTHTVGAVTNVWFAPGGRGDGSSRESPRVYYPDLLKWKLLGGDKNTDPTVIMHFLPGEYLIHPIDTATVYPSNFRITIRGEGNRPEDTVLKLAPNFPQGASDGGGSSVSLIDLARNNEYLQRFVMENITIDGNWAGQTNYNHPGYLRGYKSSPVTVSARTGRIRRVIVRNYGSHGMMPHRASDAGAGVEAFPLHVQTWEEGQEPEDGDPCPWIIEDCEVSDFHGLYNGYATALSAVTKLNRTNAPSWAFQDNSRRLIWWRRNQVRGTPQKAGVIGQGAAGIGTNYSGRITWSDNVVLNGSGFITDTGVVWDINLTNCLFLDMISLGYLGTPQVGQPYQRRYQIRDNSIRLSGYWFAWDYSDFSNSAGSTTRQSDPSLILGQRRIYRPAGLSVGGLADEITLAGNWFTTRPADQFRGLYLPEGETAQFRIVNRLPAKDPFNPKAPVIRREDAQNVNLAGNYLSSAAFDFSGLKPVVGNRVARLTERASPVLDARPPLSGSSQFVPFGAVQRVALLLTNQPRRLTWQGWPAGGNPNGPPRTTETNWVDQVMWGACEVVCGRPEPSGSSGQFSLPVRVAIQPTPGSGLGGTRPWPQIEVNLETLPGSQHPQRLTARTDARGLAQFTYPVAPQTHGVDSFRIWVDFGDGAQGVWDEFQDAWATAEFAHGTTVGVVVENGIADARNGNAAVLKLVRTGPTDRALTVNLGFDEGPLAAERGRDLDLLGPVGSGNDPGGKAGENRVITSTVTLPAGQREVILQARPKTATARNGRLLTVEVKPGEHYAAGVASSGQAVVYSPGK